MRRTGNSYAHPLVVLISSPNELALTRFGVTASKAVGSAVSRNRAKRRIRASIQSILPKVKGGWDVLVIARAPVLDADWSEIGKALQKLLKQAMILETEK